MRSLTAKRCASRVLAIWKVALICVVADYSVLSYAQSPRVYRDRVEPHWFNNNQQFWYRVDLPKGGREFVVVDTIAGSRELAFDHSLVAASLSKLLDRPVNSNQLPINELKFSDDVSDEAQTSLTLIGGDGQFVLDRTSGTLTRQTTTGKDSGTELFLPARPSGSSSEDSEIVVINQLDRTVRLFWIDGQGTERSYGEIAAGSERTQHTFVTHVWLVQQSDGSPVGCVEAKSGSTRRVLNDKTITDVRRNNARRSRSRNRGPTDTAENRSAPDGLHSVFVRDHNLWLKNASDSTETQLTSDGTLICPLESADAEEVIALRGRLPERFVAKGRDGQTDIWGIIHRPADFNTESSYPVIECIYAGPHDHHVPKVFQATSRCQSLADRGFIIVQIDGMGTAWRSKAFHDVCYRNLKDAGFPDRIAWIRAAAVQIPQMDLTRVGIYGGSAGGQNAMAALLWHHDFYKAAVADCGCHDNRMDKIWWNEQWMGTADGDHYAANSNMENAALLQGRLMLVVGELDRNVDPATTTQVARKLIAADKDFDFVMIPGAGHGACETPWGSRRRMQFFVDTLQRQK